jgi:hypothetical protein
MSKKKKKAKTQSATVHVSQAADRLLAAHAIRLDEAIAIMQMSADVLATDAEDVVTRQRALLGVDAALRTLQRVSREIRDRPAIARAIDRMESEG